MKGGDSMVKKAVIVLGLFAFLVFTAGIASAQTAPPTATTAPTVTTTPTPTTSVPGEAPSTGRGN